MKKIINIFLLLILSSQIFGQDLNSVPNNFNPVLAYRLTPLKRNTLPYEDIKGSPYYKKDFETAKIVKDYNTLVRYNIYTDEVEFQKDGQTFILPKEEKLSYIYFLASKENLKFLNTNDQLSGYFFELVSGKFMLYKKLKIIFIDLVKASSGYKEDEPASFQILDPKYYIKTERGYIKNPKNPTDVIEQIPEKKEELNSFFKSNKIKFNKEEDLIKLVNFLNQ